MTRTSIAELAELAGLETHWTDYRGRARQVGDEVLQQILSALDIDCATPSEQRASLQRLRHESSSAPAAMIITTVGEPVPRAPRTSVRYRIDLEDGECLEGRCADGEALPAIMVPGYHRLMLDNDDPVTIAVAPPRCFGLDDLAPGRRCWGLGAQIYSLTRRGDAGIGDFGGVARLARAAAEQGADAIAISPVHALFAAQPQHHAPYAPSSRLLRNPLYADAADVFGSAAVRDAIAASGLGETFAALEAQPLIDAVASARAKTALFRALHARLDASGLRTDFDAWCRDAGPALQQHACFELLHAHFLADEPVRGHWRDWPDAYRDPRTPAVYGFAQQRASELDYRMFEQWLVQRSQAAAQQTARDAGMALGLIGDLAVGTEGSGSHAWSRQREMLIGLSIGAPPDELNVKGQNWGLAAFSPRALQRDGYGAYIELLRASMQHVGGVRIDHIFGLQRLWLVPEHATPGAGAYLQYPRADLLRLLALESWQHRAVVIGEDLGTMPPGFRACLGPAGILGMRVLWFQREHGLFVEPARWPRDAVAMTTTHDLPTVCGWWRGDDLEWRERLDLLDPGVSRDEAEATRTRDRNALWAAFAYAGVASGPQPSPADAASVVESAAAFIGATPAALAILPLEDALAVSEQPNIPGTTDAHPNWRRRLPQDVEQMLAGSTVRQRLAALAQQRAAPGPLPATEEESHRTADGTRG